MSSEKSSEKQTVKIKIEQDDESTPSSDFSENPQTTGEMDEDGASQSSEPPKLAEDAAIKTEEVFIISELPGEEIAPTTSKTSNIFKCYLCDANQQFSDENTLRGHLETAHPQQKKYSCSECSEHRQYIVAFNRHLQRHDPNLRPYKCRVCPTRFTKAKNQKRHEAEAHQMKNGISIIRINQRRRVCLVCKKQVLSDTYDQHLLTEHSDAKQVCTICNAEFYNKNKLRTHRLFMHGSSAKNEEEIFKCYICKPEVVLDNQELLHQHLTAVHGKETKYRCEECNYSTRVITRLNNHLSRHDPANKPFKCSICMLRFTEARHLRYHEVSAHNVGGSQEHYDCTVCHKQFATCKAWSLHTKVHQSQQKAAHSKTKVENQNGKEDDNLSSSDTLPPPKCYLCDTVLENAVFLRLHLRINHKVTSKDPKFECTKCGFTHSRPVAFNIHLQKHDPVANPFKCTYCTLQFTSVRYRRFHEITKHGHITTPLNAANTENIKSVLRCYLCSPHTLMESKIALTRHLRDTHPRQNIYSCAQCEYTTKLKLAFNNHQAKHDPACEIYLELHSCSVCSREFSTKSRLILHQRRVGHAAPENYNPKTKTLGESRPGTSSLVESTSVQRSTSKKTYKCLMTYPCSKCHKKFVTIWSRTRHERELHGAKIAANDRKPTPSNELKCYLCKIHKTLPNKRKLMQHFRANHPSLSTYHCKKCTYSTTEQDQFNDHLAWHDPVKRKFKCNSCSRRFLTARSKRSHEIFAHQKESVNVIKLEPIDEPESIIKTEPPTESVGTNNIFTASGSAAKVYRCHLCSSNHILDSRESLLHHLAALPAQDMYHCDKCSFSVNLVTMFNQHLAQHSTT